MSQKYSWIPRFFYFPFWPFSQIWLACLLVDYGETTYLTKLGKANPSLKICEKYIVYIPAGYMVFISTSGLLLLRTKIHVACPCHKSRWSHGITWRGNLKATKAECVKWSFLLNSSCFFANNHKGDWFLLNPFYMGAWNSKLTTSLAYIC